MAQCGFAVHVFYQLSSQKGRFLRRLHSSYKEDPLCTRRCSHFPVLLIIHIYPVNRDEQFRDKHFRDKKKCEPGGMG